MISRDLAPVLLRASEDYPVVTVTGPRQSGKTTLVRELFGDHGYCNLENPETRSLAQTDPQSFFALNPGRLIIDEVQRVPELLSWIQVRVDEAGMKGHYILTGSHQLSLHEAVAQSLAGRTAMLRLLPFSFGELCAAGYAPGKGEALFKGFMPRVYNDDLEPNFAYGNYFQTYVERDVRQLIRLKDVNLFERFMKLLAGRLGQPVNYQNLGNDVGVSSTTIREWMSILDASFITFTLAPLLSKFRQAPDQIAQSLLCGTRLGRVVIGNRNGGASNAGPAAWQPVRKHGGGRCTQGASQQGSGAKSLFLEGYQWQRDRSSLGKTTKADPD